MPDPPVLGVHGVTHGYGSDADRTAVLRDVDLEIRGGQRVGLAGASGIGKSTLARILALLERPERGRVLLDGRPLPGAGLDLPASTRRRVQLLWQAPRTAVDPRYRLDQVILEVLRIHKRLPGDRTERDGLLLDIATDVGLTADLLHRRPNEVSDGQLQRACVARALLLEPDVLILDEPGSMLDVSTQAALLSTVARQVETGMAAVLVSHDRTLLEHWCDRIVTLAHPGRLT